MYRCLLTSIFFIVVIQGCATYNPLPSGESIFLERAQIKNENNIEVKTAVPSSKETRQIFGVDLYSQNIQPVWIEINNQDEKAVWFLPIGVDPMYYTPIEAAFVSNHRFTDKTKKQMNRDFFSKGKNIYIPPDTKKSGYIFTNLDEGTKSFALDLIGEDSQVRTFTFFIPVPGIKIDHQTIDFKGLYDKDAWKKIEDDQSFIEYIKRLNCCTANKRRKEISNSNVAAEIRPMAT